MNEFKFTAVPWDRPEARVPWCGAELASRLHSFAAARNNRALDVGSGQPIGLEDFVAIIEAAVREDGDAPRPADPNLSLWSVNPFLKFRSIAPEIKEIAPAQVSESWRLAAEANAKN